MLEQPPILLKMLTFCEIIAAIIGLVFYNSLKKSFWKWFVIYLVYIALNEFFGLKIRHFFKIDIQFIFAYVQIPLEFLFFIWLYALKSFRNKKLFWICITVYLISFLIDGSLSKGNYYFSSFNYIIGALIILVFVILEFNKQIKSDSILLFKENKMFYINIGVVVFYIGTLPFFGLYYPILKVPEIWNSYYIYFMVSNCVMYLLFAMSFVWGKVKSF